MRQTRIDRAMLFSLAARASVDPRSIVREFREPGSVRGMSGDRARRVLAEAGLVIPTVQAPGGSSR